MANLFQFALSRTFLGRCTISLKKCNRFIYLSISLCQLPKLLHQPGRPVLRVGRVSATLPPVSVLPPDDGTAPDRSVVGRQCVRDELRVNDPALAAPQHPEVTVRPERAREEVKVCASGRDWTRPVGHQNAAV